MVRSRGQPSATRSSTVAAKSKPTDMEMTRAPSSCAQQTPRIIISESPPAGPTILPISALRIPGATPMRTPSTVPPEQDAGAMRPVPVEVAVAGAGEILLHQVDAAERGMPAVDPGIEHRDGDVGAGELGFVRPDRADAPGLTPAPPATAKPAACRRSWLR